MSPTELFDLSGRVAVIPGGGGAIGSAIGAGLAQAGAAVAVVGRSVEPLDRAVATIETSGGKAVAITADATSPDEAQRSRVKLDIDAGPAGSQTQHDLVALAHAGQGRQRAETASEI